MKACHCRSWMPMPSAGMTSTALSAVAITCSQVQLTSISFTRGSIPAQHRAHAGVHAAGLRAGARLRRRAPPRRPAGPRAARLVFEGVSACYRPGPAARAADLTFTVPVGRSLTTILTARPANAA